MMDLYYIINKRMIVIWKLQYLQKYLNTHDVRIVLREQKNVSTQNLNRNIIFKLSVAWLLILRYTLHHWICVHLDLLPLCVNPSCTIPCKYNTWKKDLCIMFNAIKMRVARFQIFILSEFDKRKCIKSLALMFQLL